MWCLLLLGSLHGRLVALHQEVGAVVHNLITVVADPQVVFQRHRSLVGGDHEDVLLTRASDRIATLW